MAAKLPAGHASTSRWRSVSLRGGLRFLLCELISDESKARGGLWHLRSHCGRTV